MVLSYCFANNIKTKLANFLSTRFDTPPILLCLGTDKLLADCLGAIVATTMRSRNYPNYIYGGLESPITQQNAQFCHDFIHTMHPASPLIIVDSMATLKQHRLGYISITNSYIGAVNSFKFEADIFIYGITTLIQNNKLCSARLYNILTLNSIICDALEKFSKNTQKIPQKYNQANFYKTSLSQNKYINITKDKVIHCG